MKKIITCVITIGLLAACGEKSVQEKADYAVISGKVSVTENEKIQLVHNNEVIKDIAIAPDGTFRDTIRTITDNHAYYLFENPELLVPLYLDKGTQIEFTLNQDLSKVTLSGTQTGQTQYLIERELFVNKNIFRSDGALFKQEPQAFKESLKKLFAELETKLKGYNLDEDFVKRQQKWIQYKYIAALTDYPNSYEYFLKKQPTLPQDFFAERDQIDFDNAKEYETDEAYRDLVQGKYYSQLSDASDPAQVENFIKLVSALKSENIRADFAKELATLILPGNTKNKEVLDFVLSNVKDEKVKQEAQATYDKITKLAVGVPSPVFTNYENANGGTNSLSDFKGKLVYVDVWATWCRPCLAEIPALKALHDKLKGKNIEFVSISIDEDKEAWHKAVKERELKGVQLIADKAFESQFIQDYGISQIPTFLIIDKDGKIVSPNAPRPSDPQLAEVLEKLLK